VNHVQVSSFEDKYRRDGDPWRFASRDYEQRRYDLTAAALPLRRYERAFEPACAIGELTIRLAARCRSVLAMDAAPSALRSARRRCADAPGVEIRLGELPADWPAGVFDLVVLSELGYYFDRQELAVLRDRAVAGLEPGGTLLAVHWRGHSRDHLLHGDEVHEVLSLADGVDPFGAYVERDFRLDVWQRV
jgi:cyclopropane fatty-acyl-phospholipid synthase-like methyltransferase